MAITVTQTKIIVPRRRKEILSRNRLNAFLNDLLDYKLLLMAAPAGYGKTSLLVDWVYKNDLPVCWYALDPLDQDLGRFISHLLASISREFPEFGWQSRAAVENNTKANLDIEGIITAIVNDAYENIKEHFAIVLDDFHSVDASDKINEFVNRFVNEMDENCHLILASRTLLSLPDLPLMVGRSMVKGLSFDELAFRADEIQALLEQNYQQKISDEVAVELQSDTEGWITGLLLSAQTMWNGMEDRIQVARASGVGLYDYLAQQVLDQQSPLVRDFLLKTSLLEEFDTELCQSVLGEPPPGFLWIDLIGDVLQNNLFVLPVGDKGTWLRYHQLFRDFLQDQIFSENREQALSILQQLAQVYTHANTWEKAYEIYQRIEDQDGVIELIERAGTSMLKNRQLNLLNTWLDHFTPNQIESRPRLLSLQGSLNILFGQVGLGISRLDQAEIKLAESGDRLELALLTVRRSTGHGFMGNYQKALLDADKALAIVEEDPELQDVYAEALRLKGLGYYRLGDLGRAVEYLKDALQLFRSLSNPLNEAITHGDLGLAYMDSGNLTAALTHNEKAFKYWDRIGNVTRKVTVLNNIGVLHHLRGEYARASKRLNETLILAQKSGNLRIEAYALASIGDLYAELDAFDAAEEAYRLAREISMRINNQRLLIYTDLSSASVHWRNGNADKADEKLKTSENLIRKSDSTYEKGLFELISGQIALERGDGKLAISCLQSAIDYFERGGQDAEAIQTYLSLSRAYFDLGDLNRSLSCLMYALKLGQDSNCMHTLLVASRGAEKIFQASTVPVDLKPQIKQLEKQVKELEKRIPEFRRIIRRQGMVISIERAPRIKIQALGSSQVWLDGEPVSVPEWRVQKTVRELFFLLLANPDGLSKDEIGLTLWPDSSIQQLRVQFKNAMYRLRRALGKGVVEFNKKEDSYRFNWSMDYDYDVETFWKAIRIAGNSPKPVKIEAYGTAVKAYQGSYFPDGEALWIYPERERIWQTYLQAELEISRYTLEVGEYHSALAHIHRVLAQDQCQEEAHRLAMMVYSAMGNQADLVRQYEICRQALSGMLGISPSQKTESLYAELLTETR